LSEAISYRGLLASVVLAALLAAVPAAAAAQNAAVGRPGPGPALLPTGVSIDALATPGSTFYDLATGVRADGNADADQAVATSLSPDGATLLVMTSGYNTNFSTTSGAAITYPVLDPMTGQPSSQKTPNAEWIFAYDVRTKVPRKIAQINVPNTYVGLVWKPDGSGFYVSGGIDDRVYAYRAGGNEGQPYVPDAPFILLGHDSNQTAPLPTRDGGILKNTPAGQRSRGLLPSGAVVATLGISADGSLLAAANWENDSVSLIGTRTRRVTSEVAFSTPGSTKAVGEFPFGVAVRSQARGSGAPLEIYVSSQRDDQVIGVSTSGAQTIIPVGDGPNAVLLSSDQRQLYVSNGDSDSISVIDTSTDTVAATIVLHANDPYNGANPNALALSPDGSVLYVTLGGENAVAVIDLLRGEVRGLIPTGWYPNSISVSRDGSQLFIVNGKRTAGPNPANGYTTALGRGTNSTFRNEYGWALEKAGLLVAPVPDGGTLARLTALVNANNGMQNRRESALMSFLRTKIVHVIYITKENRTYDQVLGDLSIGNGARSLTMFPQAITPNHHRLALDYVVLDNYFDPGESSGVGWNWSLQGHDNEFTERSQNVEYGNAAFTGFTYDYQGVVRNLNLGLPQTSGPSASPFTTRATGLLDPSGGSSILPGSKDPAATSGDGDLSPAAYGGYLWDEALRHGKTVRNYGEHVDLSWYDASAPSYIPIVRYPYRNGAPQAPPTKPAIAANTDIYFRGFDQAAPDVYHMEEWEREFNLYVAKRDLPNLEVMTINHDHFGSFSGAIEGLTTPTLQMADDDYSLGRIVQDVENSPFAANTAIFVNEDDSQSGPDHVDSHRSFLLIISPYTKRRTLVHSVYTTVNAVRTITDLLGVHHLGLQDANAAPIAEAFTTHAVVTRYAAIIPGVLCRQPVSTDLVPDCRNPAIPKTAAAPSLHGGAWWAARTVGMNFRRPDAVDAAEFNRLLWDGTMRGGAAPPIDD